MSGKNILISDVTLNWPKLDAPVSPFGTPQWEIQVEVSDDQAKALAADGLPVKQRDGKNVISLKRKATKRDGSANDPVRVVDAQKAPMMGRSKIGNGSKGNIIAYQMPYEFAGQKGITNILVAVQVTDLVEFSASGGVDFDVIGDEMGADSPF